MAVLTYCGLFLFAWSFLLTSFLHWDIMDIEKGSGENGGKVPKLRPAVKGRTWSIRDLPQMQNETEISRGGPEPWGANYLPTLRAGSEVHQWTVHKLWEEV